MKLRGNEQLHIMIQNGMVEFKTGYYSMRNPAIRHFIVRPVPILIKQLSRYKYQDERGPFRAENLTAPHFSPTRTIEWRGTHPGSNRQWRFSLEELELLYGQGRILLQRDGRPRKDGYKVYLDEAEGPALQDIWTDIGLGPTAGERLGYPTQKPLLITRAYQKPAATRNDNHFGSLLWLWNGNSGSAEVRAQVDRH